ncbi:MAG: S9 family peptidase, partial [Gemmatimonadetes bacterium]|nr:S9 family peptidase [Gemmatimonadota bacterium]
MTRLRFAMPLMSVTLLAAVGATGSADAQGTAADYARADSLRRRWEGLVVDAPEPANWIGNSSRFWYRKGARGGNSFVLADAATGTKAPAFDHARIAEALGPQVRRALTAVTLPFNTITFTDD